MTISLNGESVEIREAKTIAELIDRYELPPQSIVVEHNGLAVHRHEWAERPLAEGDRIEFVRVVAGGYFCSALRRSFHRESHSVGLYDGHGCLGGDEFAFGDNIDDSIRETRLSAGSQNCHRSAVGSGCQRECGHELSWYANQRWAGWI